MKKYLLAVLLLASFQSFGQFLNYTNINGRYKWIAGKFDSTFTIPVGTTPSLRTGGGNAPGALFYSTTDSTVYQYSGTQWTRLRGSDTAHVISAYVRNTTASAMTPGQVVYINGSTGTTPTIALAVNKQDSTSAMTFGFVRGNIPVNGFGYITTFGPLEGVNTNAYTEGEVIYLDSIPGKFTHDKPQAPYHMVTLGYIIKKSGGNGTIYAKVQNGYELDELHNVRITEPVLNKSVIIYDSVRRLWVDTTVSAAGLGLGGSGTTNYVSKWTGSTALGNSQIFDNGTAVGIGTGTLVTKAGKWLQVTQDGTDEVAFVINRTAGSFPIRWDFYVPNNTRQLRLYNNSTGDIGAFTQAGRLLIGTTTESTYELDLVGDFRSTLDANINGLTVGKGGGNNANNTAVGFESLLNNTTGFNNTAIGYQALKPNTTGFLNTAVGYLALASGTSAGRNVAVGFGALFSLTNQERNVAVGNNALSQTTTGFSNTAIGDQAGNSLTTGNGNTFVGSGSTGNGITTGQYNTIIGAAVSGLSSSLSNTIILADGQGNQRLYINSSGNAAIGTSTIISKTGRWLQITATSNVESSLVLNRTGGVSDARWDLYIPASSNALRLYNSNAGDIATFTNSGRLLLGTTTESTFLLDVNGTARIGSSANSYSTFAFESANTGTRQVIYGSSYSILQLQNASRNIQLYHDGTMNISSGTAFTVNGLYSQNITVDYFGGVVINETGTANHFFRVEGDTNVNLFYTAPASDNIGMGTATPNASALLDVSSTTKGFLPPRMTNAQMVAIATPAAGLVVYDTTNNKLNVYDGTNWVTLH
jgi:hypothetical protein